MSGLHLYSARLVIVDRHWLAFYFLEVAENRYLHFNFLKTGVNIFCIFDIHVTSAVLSSCCKLAYTSVLRQFGVIWPLWLVKGLKTNTLLINWREPKKIYSNQFLINITQLVPYISIAGIFTTVFIFFWNIIVVLDLLNTGYSLTIFISIWLASMFPQFFRMYYISLLIRWRKQPF